MGCKIIRSTNGQKTPSRTPQKRPNTPGRSRCMSGGTRSTTGTKPMRWEPSSSLWSEASSERRCSGTIRIRPTTHSHRLGDRGDDVGLRQGRGNPERDGKEIGVAVPKTDDLQADGQPGRIK